jgi:hypothetical protein
MAFRTGACELAHVNILVAACAALGCKHLHGATIIVTAQALRPCVGALELEARLGLVIEFEVFLQVLPIAPFVAKAAIRGEIIVGHDRPQPTPPTVQSNVGATDGHTGDH